MSRDLWCEAEEAFCENFYDEHDREPTEDEIRDGMEDFYTDYISGLADQAYDSYKDSLMDDYNN